ncbi:hypothetical protein, partial [Microseira sp. BLCC-F43]|uniref:hypothetical protein n=1 Tax=Microseira sp. BLCC-F43 TaxID=3153602 RepID=UPI0035BA3E18
HSPSLYQIKRLRCLAPTLKHRHTHDLLGHGIHHLCTRSKDFAALPLLASTNSTPINTCRGRGSLFRLYASRFRTRWIVQRAICQVILIDTGTTGTK